MKTKRISEFTIYEWMKSELALKGNELIAFALIYHHTRKNAPCVNNGFIADWLGVSRCNASRILCRLEAKGVIAVFRTTGYANAYFCTNQILDRHA